MSPYADDLLLYRPIQSRSDYQTLQADIDALSDWTSAHKLQLNCDKCKCILINNDQPLENVFLGILLTPDVSTLCSKARQ